MTGHNISPIIICAWGLATDLAAKSKKIKHFYMRYFKLLVISILIGPSLFAQPDSTHNIKPGGDSKSYATLYVYRQKSFVGSMISYNLSVNDSTICRMKNNSKYIIRLYKEGETELTAKTEKKSSVRINVEFGKEYYLKCGVKTGIMAGRPQLELIDPEQGKLDFQNVEGRNKESEKEN